MTQCEVAHFCKTLTVLGAQN